MHCRAKPCTATPAPQRQNPGREQYMKVILEHRKAILALSSYLVVDGCFMKKDFIAPLLQKGLHVITRAGSAANLRSGYKGKAKG
ncbi:MAG: hypothetical protein ICV79_18020 [Flavisolibacter sp.]|nr:hypothetical protein [Flavisolibacter sp.]